MPETRDTLLQTAARLFHEQGYAGTGVATILREATANPGSFYHFFPSKEALLQGVLEWYHDNLHPFILAPIEAAQPDPLERIFDLLAWYRAFMVQSECRLGCPIANLALELCDSTPGVRPEIQRNFENWTAGVRGWLEAGRSRLPSDCNLDALSQFVLTVMEGGLMQSRAAGNVAPFDAGVTIVRDYFDRLLADAAAETT